MDPDDISEEELLVQKHKQEKKDLQADILQIRHASKNDKKKKKEATVQIAQMEAALQQRHEEELRELRESKTNTTVAGVESLSISDGEETESSKGKKVSKAQKRRDKKAQQERERDELIRAAAIENLQGPRHQEQQSMKRILAEKALRVHEIPSDGNCLYAAINHQLLLRKQQRSVSELRKLTADNMRSHRGEFLPFLYNQESGEPYTEGQFDEYCEKLETTNEWGGQLEIQALSNVVCCPIEVLQYDTTNVISGEDQPNEKIVLAQGRPRVTLLENCYLGEGCGDKIHYPYYRHAYGLGEHYNSTLPLSASSTEQEDT